VSAVDGLDDALEHVGRHDAKGALGVDPQRPVNDSPVAPVAPVAPAACTSVTGRPANGANVVPLSVERNTPT